MIIRIILEDTSSAYRVTFTNIVLSWETAVYLEPWKLIWL